MPQLWRIIQEAPHRANGWQVLLSRLRVRCTTAQEEVRGEAARIGRQDRVVVSLLGTRLLARNFSLPVMRASVHFAEKQRCFSMLQLLALSRQGAEEKAPSLRGLQWGGGEISMALRSLLRTQTQGVQETAQGRLAQEAWK
jgi:hypothetical protein